MIGLAFLGDDLSRRAMEETSDQRRRALNFAADVMYYHSGATDEYKAALDELRWTAGMLAGLALSLEDRMSVAVEDLP